jgi:hypothetical protein
VYQPAPGYLCHASMEYSSSKLKSVPFVSCFACVLLVQADYVLQKLLSRPLTPEEVTDAIKAVTLPNAASISKRNALTPSTTEEPASNRSYNLAKEVFGIPRPHLYQTFHLIAEAQTVMDLRKQAEAAAVRGDKEEATRLSQLAADRVERVWRNHAELVNRCSAARASTIKRKAAARKKRQPDALDGTQSAIRDTSLKLFARLPQHVREQALEKLKGRPAAEYTTAGTRYNLVVDGKEAADRMHEKVLPRLDTLTEILSGRVSFTLPPANSPRLVDQLARLYPATGPALVASQEEAHALAKEFSEDWRTVVAIGMFSQTVTGALCWLRWCQHFLAVLALRHTDECTAATVANFLSLFLVNDSDTSIRTRHADSCAAATTACCYCSCCCCCCHYHYHPIQVRYAVG